MVFIAADREHPKGIAAKRSGDAQIKACEGPEQFKSARPTITSSYKLLAAPYESIAADREHPKASRRSIAETRE